jgi:uncharacterized protein (TIGR03382 family)
MRLASMPVASKLAVTAACTALVAGIYLTRTAGTAEACGCFAPPDPSVPIVQTGEQIAFAMKDGVVTAHIQVQYAGEADEFAWLVPLPSQPTMSLGTDELFAQLVATTQPRYRLNREYYGSCGFEPPNFGGGPANDSAGGAEGADPDSPLVLRDTVGPYDYAVLRADSKEPMLTWLNENRFFVPAGTDTAVDPYIREGAFFLALKLRKGSDVGDLQPVVLEYQADLPMIPIVLTSVAADPDMGILVWVLGEHRAIPRNYYHTKINDAAIDWLNFGANYVEVVTRAVDEADGKRSFVTEYAGQSSIMVDLLDYDWRYGELGELRQLTDAVAYVNYLNSYGYGVQSNQPPFFGTQFGTQLLSLLQRELPVPSALLEEGITPNDYYTNIGYYLGWYKDEYPEKFADLDVDFDPVVLTDDIEERIVRPTLAAGQMFRDNPYMTRMFTTLSPEDMTRDPVFSFNPDLPEVSNIHEGRLMYLCGAFGSDDQATTPARIVTEDGWVLELPNGEQDNPWLDADMPYSRYTEILREEGDPQIVKDHSKHIEKSLESYQGDGGCNTAGTRGGLAALGLLLLSIAVAVRRRRA